MTEEECALASTVCVRDLPLSAIIGVNPDELGRRQPLLVTVHVTLDAMRIQTIDETVDYRTLVALAEELSERHVPLIETFAQRLAERCLELPHAQEARVRIDKPSALPRGLAGVDIVARRRAALGGFPDRTES